MSTAWDRTRQPVPASTRQRILNRDGHTCQACGGTRCNNQRLEIDHRVPHAEGGTDRDDNLQALGKTPCHTEKTHRERLRGIARRNPKRPAEQHPGFTH